MEKGVNHPEGRVCDVREEGIRAFESAASGTWWDWARGVARCQHTECQHTEWCAARGHRAAARSTSQGKAGGLGTHRVGDVVVDRLAEELERLRRERRRRICRRPLPLPRRRRLGATTERGVRRLELRERALAPDVARAVPRPHLELHPLAPVVPAHARARRMSSRYSGKASSLLITAPRRYRTSSGSVANNLRVKGYICRSRGMYVLVPERRTPWR